MENQEQSDVTKNHCIVSVANWITTMILMCIPLINLIMLLVWAFSGSTSPSKANWAKATLIFMFIGIVLVVLFWRTIYGTAFAFL